MPLRQLLQHDRSDRGRYPGACPGGRGGERPCVKPYAELPPLLPKPACLLPGQITSTARHWTHTVIAPQSAH
jgi:hypothetical protein